MLPCFAGRQMQQICPPAAIHIPAIQPVRGARDVAYSGHPLICLPLMQRLVSYMHSQEAHKAACVKARGEVGVVNSSHYSMHQSIPRPQLLRHRFMLCFSSIEILHKQTDRTQNRHIDI